MNREIMNTKKQERSFEKETGRIEAFSDGVFAIAITLLVVDLKVPSLEHISSEALSAALLRQWPFYLSFLLSFTTILVMWVNHHGIFRMIYRINIPFLFANGFLLLLVSFVSYPTALLSTYLLTPVAAVVCAIYAGVYVMINIAYSLLWWSAVHSCLLRPSVPPSQSRRLTRNLLLGCSTYLLATLLSFWNAYVSVGLCFGLWIFWAFVGYITHKVQFTTPEEYSG